MCPLLRALVLPLVVLVLVLLSFSSKVSGEYVNALVQGTRKSGDQLLFEFRLVRHFKLLQVVQDTVVYPMTAGQTPGTITQVEVRSPRFLHGDVRVTSGGVGRKFVNIRFHSGRSRGLDYNIKIYGTLGAGTTTAAPTGTTTAAPTETTTTDGGDATTGAAVSSESDSADDASAGPASEGSASSAAPAA